MISSCFELSAGRSVPARLLRLRTSLCRAQRVGDHVSSEVFDLVLFKQLRTISPLRARFRTMSSTYSLVEVEHPVQLFCITLSRSFQCHRLFVLAFEDKPPPPSFGSFCVPIFSTAITRSMSEGSYLRKKVVCPITAKFLVETFILETMTATCRCTPSPLSGPWSNCLTKSQQEVAGVNNWRSVSGRSIHRLMYSSRLVARSNRSS